MKHTPGPWSIQEFPPRMMEIGNYEGENLRAVCDVPWMGGSDEEDEANARLICTAPELYNLAKSIGEPVVRGGDAEPRPLLCGECKERLDVCDSKPRPYCYGNVARGILKRIEE
jgi:hypothetical protein